MRRWLARALQLLLAAILAATALGKLLDVGGFVAVLRTYQALHAALEWPLAVAVIVVELVLAFLLAVRVREASTALACALLHVGYAAWAAIALVRGLHIANCGCFGVFWARPLTWTTVVEDGVVVAASLLLWRLVRTAPSTATSAAPT
jgi:hypothetical protein